MGYKNTSLVLICKLVLDAELDSLRKGQRITKVYRIGLSSHVHLPCVRSSLPASASLLLSAKGAADLCSGSADIDVGDATIRSFMG